MLWSRTSSFKTWSRKVSLGRGHLNKTQQAQGGSSADVWGRGAKAKGTASVKALRHVFPWPVEEQHGDQCIWSEMKKRKSSWR